MRAVWVLSLMIWLGGEAAQAQIQVQDQGRCRQALLLALDVSGSVDSREYQLQLQGLASALIDPDVQNAILAQPNNPVHLAVYEWSGPLYQRVLLGWSKLTSQKTLFEVSSHLANLQRQPAPPGTALGNSMQFGVNLLTNGPLCRKRTLDISGDGKSNFGPHPRDIRAGLPAGSSPDAVTINALVIGSDAPVAGDTRQVEISELSAYFNAWVIFGPDAFVETAIGFDDYHQAMTRKLLRELETLAVSSLELDAASPFQ